jgi:hypothetical protein
LGAILLSENVKIRFLRPLRYGELILALEVPVHVRVRALVHIDIALGGLRVEEGMVLLVLRVNDLGLHLHNLDLVGAPLVLLRVDVEQVLQLLVLPFDAFPEHHVNILFLTGLCPLLALLVLWLFLLVGKVVNLGEKFLDGALPMNFLLGVRRLLGVVENLLTDLLRIIVVEIAHLQLSVMAIFM